MLATDTLALNEFALEYVNAAGTLGKNRLERQ